MMVNRSARRSDRLSR